VATTVETIILVGDIELDLAPPPDVMIRANAASVVEVGRPGARMVGIVQHQCDARMRWPPSVMASSSSFDVTLDDVNLAAVLP